MYKKILSIFIIFFLISCEEFYNFEANKLDTKFQELVKMSEDTSDLNEKIILLTEGLEKLKKIQKRYPKTKIARKLRNFHDRFLTISYLKN